MNELGVALAEVRAGLAGVADEVLPDTCRLLVGANIYYDVPCRLKSASGNVDGAPYRLRLAWGSPAVVGAAVVVEEIDGRSQLTLQLIEPVDSSTGVWQDWQATSAPAFGRADIGL